MITNPPVVDQTQALLDANLEALMRLAERLSEGPKKQGFDRSFIRSLPTIRCKHRIASTQTFCVVCMNHFREKDLLRFLPSCNHEFHAKCIDKWLKMRKTCPVCRTEVRAHSPGLPYSM